jgi:SNF2 family DNA or RNA helicase
MESNVNDDGAEAHERRLARERKLKAPDHAYTKIECLKNIKQRHQVKPVKQQKWVDRRVYTSLCNYKFVRVVLDEAHVIRNLKTLLAKALL